MHLTPAYAQDRIYAAFEDMPVFQPDLWLEAAVRYFNQALKYAVYGVIAGGIALLLELLGF